MIKHKILKLPIKITGLSLLFFLILIIFPLEKAQAQAWKFAVCGDTRSDHTAHAKNVSAIINKMPNDSRVTIWNLGDITANGTPSEWITWQGIVAPLGIDWTKNNPPGYMSPLGNHDTYTAGWESWWIYSLPGQVNISAYPEISAHVLGLYGSLKYDNVLWIWLDSQNSPAGQDAFLEDTLTQAVSDSEVTWKFVMFHHPPITCGGPHSDWEAGKTWHNNYFEPYGVDVVFNGHVHHFLRTCPITDPTTKACDESNRGNVIEDSEGVVYIVSGGGGAPLYAVGSCSYIESGGAAHHFQEVVVDGSTLNIKTWSTDSGSATDPLLLDNFIVDKCSNCLNNCGLCMDQVHRFWSSDNQSHFYTSNLLERDLVINNYSDSEWSYEGTNFSIFTREQGNTIPVYRFWSQQNSAHFYTANELEKNDIINNYSDDQWQYEEVSFWAYAFSQTRTDPVYRFWIQENQAHFYTSDESEKDNLINNSTTNEWQYEGVAWYAPRN